MKISVIQPFLLLYCFTGNRHKIALCYSFALRHNIRSRNYNHPTDDERYGKVPRHAEQRKRIHEIARGSKGPFGEGNGLCCFHLGHDERIRSR